MSIIQRVPWLVQPQGPAQLNAASWQSRGLVRWYPLNGYATDPSKKFDGTLTNGATFAPTSRGLALKLDGTDDCLLTPSGALGLSGLTFSAWIFPTGSNAARNTVFGSEGAASNVMIEVGPGSFSGIGTAKLNLASTGGNATETASGAITYNTWNHIAGTHPVSNSLGILYINGGLATLSNGAAHPITDGAVAHAIGRRQSASQLFSGSIQDLRLYDYVMSDAQVWSLYADRHNLFAPQTRRIWVPGAVDVASASNQPGNPMHPGKTISNMARFMQTKQGLTPRPTAIKFRKTLSGIGSRSGSRQTHH